MRRSRSSSRSARLSEVAGIVSGSTTGAAALSAEARLAATLGGRAWHFGRRLVGACRGRPAGARYRARPPLHRRSHCADRNRFRAALSYRPDRRLDIRRDAAEECRGSRRQRSLRDLAGDRRQMDARSLAAQRALHRERRGRAANASASSKAQTDRPQGTDPPEVRHPYRQSVDQAPRAWAAGHGRSPNRVSARQG